MILPITPHLDRKAHQSEPPRGLILDAAYEAQNASKHAEWKLSGHLPDNKHIDVDGLSGQLCEISISHDGDFATAVALVPSQAQGQLRQDESMRSNMDHYVVSR